MWVRNEARPRTERVCRVACLPGGESSKKSAQGILGTEFDRSERGEVQARVREAAEAAKDEVWGGYRFVALADNQSEGGLKVIDLGAGHSSGSETLCGRVVAALKSGALLNDSVGAGYIERHWPLVFKDTGAWPLTSLRQSFLNGSLTRLIDPDATLRKRILEFVETGEFGLASGDKGGGHYERVWFKEPVGAEEVAFESGVFLLTRAKAEQIRAAQEGQSHAGTESKEPSGQDSESEAERGDSPTGPTKQPVAGHKTTLRLKGTVPPEVWEPARHENSAQAPLRG